MPTRWREVFLATPKVALATEYLLPTGARLLAVNVHCLNFERWGTLKFHAQLTALQARMAKHTGPILLAGDFNTWNQRRLRLVTELARDLQLREVGEFSSELKTGDRQSAVLNWLLGIDRTLPLDRVYYRGLSPLSATVLPLTSSDHRALQVTFAVEGRVQRVPEVSQPLRAEFRLIKTEGDLSGFAPNFYLTTRYRELSFVQRTTYSYRLSFWRET